MNSISTRRRSERGETDIKAIIKLMITVLLGIMVWNASPVILKNNALEDKIREISSGFPNGEVGNVKAREALAAAIEELELSQYIPEDACKVSSEGGMGGTRTVECTYTRELKLLPGFVRNYTFHPSKTSPTM